MLVLSLAVLFGLCFLVALGCVKSLHAFRRAAHTERLLAAEHAGVRYHYPRRRCGRAVDVYHPARHVTKAA